MLKVNASFQRKECQLRTDPCVVEKIISLPPDEYQAFSHSLLRDQDFIRDNIERMYVDDEEVSHCLLALTETLRGMLDESENQNARMLFKLAVEIDMMMHILAVSYEIDDSYLRTLRGRCVEEVRRSNGTISLEKAAQTEQQNPQ